MESVRLVRLPKSNLEFVSRWLVDKFSDRKAFAKQIRSFLILSDAFSGPIVSYKISYGRGYLPVDANESVSSVCFHPLLFFR